MSLPNQYGRRWPFRGPLAARRPEENAARCRLGQRHVDVGVYMGERRIDRAERTGRLRHTHTHTAGLLHVSTLPLALLPAVCPLHLSHTEGLMTSQLT